MTSQQLGAVLFVCFALAYEFAVTDLMHCDALGMTANYKHSILGDPIPGASAPGSCASPHSSQLFLGTLEPKPENSSAMFFHPTLDQKNDSGLEDDFNGSNQIVHEFARKVQCDARTLLQRRQDPSSLPVPAL